MILFKVIVLLFLYAFPQATFAEIPGVLETGTIRKIDRRYPFNDACQV